MPHLSKARVLITRAAEDLPVMIQAVEAAGGESVALPLLAFTPGSDLHRLQGDVAALTPQDWIVLTSRRAAKALATRYFSGGARLAVVGAQTASALRGFGLEPDLVGDGSSGAAGLARLLIQQNPRPQSVLWCTSDLAREALSDALLRHGIRVLRREAYCTARLTPDSAALQRALSRALQAAILASPSAMDAFMSILPVGWAEAHQLTLRIVVPGQTTAEAARSLGWKQVVVAASPRPQDLAEAALA